MPEQGFARLCNKVTKSIPEIILLLVILQTVSGRKLSDRLGHDPNHDPNSHTGKPVHTSVMKDLRCICGETSIFCCLLFDDERGSSYFGNSNRKIPKEPKRRPTGKTPIPARKPWPLIGCNLQLCQDVAGAVSHASSCVHYINCWKSCGWLQSCPSSLVFNAKSASCDWPSRLDEGDPCYAVNTLRMDWKHVQRDRVSDS